MNLHAVLTPTNAKPLKKGIGGVLAVKSEKRTHQLFTMISYFLGVSSFETGRNVSILLLML